MPTPPDELIQKGGFHAANVPLEESSQVFVLRPPKKLSTKHRELIYFPNQDLPTWFIFKYEFEKEIVDTKMEVHSVDIMKKLVELAQKK
jgi:hypothetical protein